jgi:predicted RNA-binding Zn ribbon-like protein
MRGHDLRSTRLTLDRWEVCLVDAHRFDQVDLEQMRLLSRLSPGERIQVLLDARELTVGLIRGRLRRQYPDLSSRELNLKVLEELARAERTSSRP